MATARALLWQSAVRSCSLYSMCVSGANHLSIKLSPGGKVRRREGCIVESRCSTQLVLNPAQEDRKVKRARSPDCRVILLVLALYRYKNATLRDDATAT